MVYKVEATTTRKSLKNTSQIPSNDIHVLESDTQTETTVFIAPMVQIFHQMIITSETKRD